MAVIYSYSPPRRVNISLLDNIPLGLQPHPPSECNQPKHNVPFCKPYISFLQMHSQLYITAKELARWAGTAMSCMHQTLVCCHVLHPSRHTDQG